MMAKIRGWIKLFTAALLAAGLVMSPAFCAASDDVAAPPQRPAAADAGLYIKVQLADRIKLSKLEPGDVVEGTLARDVYSGDRELFPAGSRVRLTVDHLERRKRPRNDHWPWVVNAFTPRHENYPAFKTATVSQAQGESSLQVSLISVSRKREVHALAKKNKSAQQPDQEHGTVEVSKSNAKQSIAPVMVLEAFGINPSAPASQNPDQQAESVMASPGIANPSSANPSPADLPTGTLCKILLLGDVSASKSRPDDTVRARLLEPVLLNSRVVLPAGSMIEGKVVKRTPPRWGSRAGSLSLAFTGLTLPGGNLMPITASLTGAELDRRSHTKIDAEGKLHGEHPGKAWMAINIGVTAGLAKEADDTLQLIIEAIVSTATDASTAGVGRIAATCVSGIFMVSRHGRDVILPRFTEMEISLDRPLSVTPAARTRSSVPPVISPGSTK
jgi:hypothetical protein